MGFVGASVFWYYGPFLKNEIGRQEVEVQKDQAGKAVGPEYQAPLALQGVRGSAWGGRYQVVTDGKETFLADLKEGRVWRYFRHTREGGYLKDEEGFLPLPFFYGGKKYPSADLKAGE